MTLQKEPGTFAISPLDYLPIAVRAYVPLAKVEPIKPHRPSPKPSPGVLIFDTETTTDPSQRLRFGSFQWCWASELKRRGLFYDPKTLSSSEHRLLISFCRQHGLEWLSVEEFIEDIFFKLAYQLRGTIVGFNLPFDISRLAIKH